MSEVDPVHREGATPTDPSAPDGASVELTPEEPDTAAMEAKIRARTKESRERDKAGDSGPHYRTPDGGQPIAETIWQRVDADTVVSTLTAITSDLTSTDTTVRVEQNGSLRLQGIFRASPDEKKALEDLIGSEALREAVDLLATADSVNGSDPLGSKPAEQDHPGDDAAISAKSV